MQRITFVVLLLAALGLGAFVYFYEIKGEADRESAKNAEKQLFQIDTKSVSSLEIQNENGTFGFKRSDDGWKLVAPRSLDADQGAVEDVLYAVNTLRFTQIVDAAPAALQPYGLEPPHQVLTFTIGENTHSLLVGEDSPFGGMVYIKKAETPDVYLTSYPLKTKLNKTLTDWRNKKLLEFSVSDIQGLSIEGDGQPPLEVHRDGSLWIMSTAPGHRLDATHFDTLLYDLLGLNVVDFTGETDLASYGLEPPRWKVTLYEGGEAPALHILFGTPDNEAHRLPVLLNPGDEIRLVRMSIETKLSTPLEQLRDKRVLPAERYTIDRLAATVTGETLSASKNGEGWTLEGSLKDRLKPTDVDAILNDLTELKADGLIDNVPTSDLGRFGLETPDIDLTVSEGIPTAETGRTYSLGIGRSPESPSQVFAKLKGEPTVYLINRFVLDDLRDVLLKPQHKDEDKSTQDALTIPEEKPSVDTPLPPPSSDPSQPPPPIKQMLKTDVAPSPGEKTK